jgi:tetratricopeptide (TPR) repeat protein
LSIRHLNKGTGFYNKGCFTKAARHFQEAHERFSAADNLQGTADSLNSLANAYYRLNDMESAQLVYDEAVELYALLNNSVGQIRALANKSVALASAGELPEAQAALDKADTLAERDGALATVRLKARAILRFKRNDVDGSEKLLSKVIRAVPKSDTKQYASAQYTMGYVLLSSRQPNKAIPYLNRALTADRAAGDYFSIGQDLEALGDCHAQLGEHALAATELKRSIKIYGLLNNIEKVQQVSPKLLKSASIAGTEAQTTLNWVARWLAGQWEANICRQP